MKLEEKDIKANNSDDKCSNCKCSGCPKCLCNKFKSIEKELEDDFYLTQVLGVPLS